MNISRETFKTRDFNFFEKYFGLNSFAGFNIEKRKKIPQTISYLRKFKSLVLMISTTNTTNYFGGQGFAVNLLDV